MIREVPKQSRDAAASKAASHVSQLEQELRDTLERYELIFKATNDILYDLNIQTGGVVWNSALYTQFGYTKYEPADTLEWWVEHIHPDDAMKVEHDLQHWLAGTGQTWQSEYRFRKASGAYAYIRDRGFVTRDDNGSPLRIIGSFLDISEQKKLERAKDEFISLVSHQLRTPLTVIRVYGEMFLSGFFGHLNGHQELHIARMTSASVKLIKLVDDILNVSRIELGDFKVTPMPVDINAIITEAIQEVAPIAAEKNVSITFRPGKKHLRPVIDQSIFLQILDNFLTNAVRYTRPSRGQIDVTFAEKQDEYILCVKDNGIGIPKNAQARIFDRFYRAANAINIEEQGTGLGLYLVTLMTRAVNGRVWFETRLNKGTAFYLAVPHEPEK